MDPGSTSSDNVLPRAARHVADCLQTAGHPHLPVLLDGSARTAAQAASALGVQLGQIAKSIVFRRLQDEAAVLVITAGDRRVDEDRLGVLVGAVGRADADFVRSKIGFAIGGVSPIGFSQRPVIVVDESLFRFDEIWAAAGHPRTVFKLRPADLAGLTGGAPVAAMTAA